MVQAQLTTLKKRLAQLQQQEEQDCEGELTTLLALGAIYQDKGRKKLALSTWQEAAWLCSQLKRHREASALYIRMAKHCEEMNHSQKAVRYFSESIDCLERSKKITAEDLVTIARHYKIMAELESSLHMAHQYYLHAREMYRMLDDVLEEVHCWLAEANKYFEAWYQEEGLAYARYGIDLLTRLPSPPALLQEAEQRLQAREAYLRQEYGESSYQHILQASAEKYAAAATEAEREHKKRQERQRDLASEVKRMGLLFHEQGRKEPDTLEAVSCIQTHGFSRSAMSSYREAQWQLRDQHNRLGEALITGTITVIEQVQSTWEKEEFEALLSLYRDAQDIVGQIRTLYNYGVNWVSHSSKDLNKAVAYVHCALLGLQHSPHLHEPTLKTRGEKRLAVWSRQMTPPAYQQALQTGKALFAFHLTTPHLVHVQCAPLQEATRWWLHEEQDTLVVAEVPHLLAATRFILDAILAEAEKPFPEQVEWEARRLNEKHTVYGLTTGYGFAHKQGPCASRLLRVRFLEWRCSNDETWQEGFEPLTRTLDRTRLGIREYPYDRTLERILGYLDRPWLDHMSRFLMGRAVELVNENDQGIGCISWDHRCHSRAPSLRRPPTWVDEETQEDGTAMQGKEASQ